MNDIWIIDGIESFTDNEVSIFNRWGDLVREFKGYDNADKVWKGEGVSGREMPAGTYFYSIETGVKEKKKKKGWVYLDP